MRLHDCVFFRCQSPRLAQNRGEHFVYLPNVVQQRSDRDSFYLLLPQTNCLCDKPRVSGHAPGVTRRIRIPSFDGCNHELQQFLIGLLKFPVDLVKTPDNEARNYKEACTQRPPVDITVGEYIHAWEREKIEEDSDSRSAPPKI